MDGNHNNYDRTGFGQNGRCSEKERMAYLVFYGLWLIWACYLACWAAACFARMPTDGSAYGFESFGIPSPAAYYLIGCLELFGAALWAAAGALVLRLACVVIQKMTGHQLDMPAKQVHKYVRYGWLGIFVLMVIDAVACSVYAMLPIGAMLADDRGAGPLLAIFTGPILFMTCAIGCVVCAAIAAASVPVLDFIVNSVAMAKRGMDGKGMLRQ